ncbi:MAG: ABC-2 transporter permease [Oscillospiraceae bacterium]|nr:ABC-2 transporter permease [Oscillospiraceae bacterium]
MKNLLIKDFRLAMHPTVFLFWLLSAMLLIPNYPYYVVLFYSSLSLFFVCLGGRENRDIEFSLMLPVRKRDAVRARICFAVISQAVQLIVAVPFAALRQAMSVGGNQVGMDANIAFFGFALLLFGIFNLQFFTSYYRAPEKVGRTFAASSVILFAVIAVFETLTHTLPFFRLRLDTPDPAFLPEKLAVLAIGLAAYVLLTFIACRISEKRFESLDI